jgi:hypothetical protein
MVCKSTFVLRDCFNRIRFQIQELAFEGEDRVFKKPQFDESERYLVSPSHSPPRDISSITSITSASPPLSLVPLSSAVILCAT